MFEDIIKKPITKEKYIEYWTKFYKHLRTLPMEDQKEYWQNRDDKNAEYIEKHGTEEEKRLYKELDAP